MTGTPLATPADVRWRPLTSADEISEVADLIRVASAKLRQACPFDLDARMALYATAPSDRNALDPVVVADVVGSIVRRALVNPDGAASVTQSVGPFSESRSYATRSNPTAGDERAGVRVTAGDIDQLRPVSVKGLPRVIGLEPTRSMLGYRRSWLP